MAVDKLVDSTQLDADLTSVANAIRTKGGTSAQMAFPAGFVSAVNAIPSGVSIDYLHRPKVGDGNAYIYIYLPNIEDLIIRIYFLPENNPVLIEWGDGSEETVSTGSYFEHTYSTTGYYTIKLTQLTGTSALLGGAGNTWVVGGGESTVKQRDSYKLIGVETGTWDFSTFELIQNSNCSFVYAGDSPITERTIHCRSNRLLHTIELNNAVSIMSYWYSDDLALKKITIPYTVTEIQGQSFNGIYGLTVHLEPTTPPNLTSTSAFTDTAKFYVPYSDDHSILDAYKEATNWSTFAENIFEEEP